MMINELFLPHQGNGFELCNMTESQSTGVNFVSRTSQNNGVAAQVCRDEHIAPFSPGMITVALGGSVLSSFVQTKPFYTAFHMMVLEPRNKMSFCEKLFYCMCIRENAYRYNYGRQANRTLKDIELPNVVPDWVYDTPIKPVKATSGLKTPLKHDVNKWGMFRIGDLFKLENCKCNIARELSDGDECYYIGAKKNDNGVMRRVAYDKELITKGNCIVFICDGQGSVGYTNYMNHDFIGSSTLTVGYSEWINKYIGLFLVSVLDLERVKFSFGRKYRTKLADTLIRLPAKGESPDWAYMESYIKSLPYSDRI